jgi:DHA1 family multidrug resistance protein-like MFS transporter
LKPSFRASWIWLLAIYTVATFIESVFWGQMTAFTPIFLRQLGMEPSQISTMVGLIAAVVGAAGIPFLPFWGALADRYSRKPLVVRSYAVYLLAGIIAVLAGNVWIFVIGRSLMGLSLGNTGLMLTTLSERTPGNRVGLAFAIMSGAGPVGAALGPLLGGPIVDHWGFRVLLAINVAIMVIVVLGLALGYSDNYRSRRTEPILRMAIDSVRVSFQAGRLRTLFAAFFLLYAGWTMVYSYLPLVVQRLYSGPNPASAIGLVVGLGGLLALIISPIFGSLADRFGHWPVLFIAAGIEAAFWLVAFWARNLYFFAVVSCLIIGIASAVFSISFNVLSSSAPTSIRGRVMSFAYLPANLGYFFGPSVGSQLAKLDLFYIFPVACALTVLGIMVLNVARKQPVPGEGIESAETRIVNSEP